MILLIDSQYFAPIIEIKSLIRNTSLWVSLSGKYQKHSFANRLMIAGSQGLLNLSIPVIGGRNTHQVMSSVKIDHRTNWRIKHWRSIESCYRRSPYFEFYETDLRKIYEQEYEFLWNWNHDLLQWTLNKMGCSAHLTPNFGFDSLPADILDLTKKIFPRNYKDAWTSSGLPPYQQVFSSTHGFMPNLSIVDLLFNLGPQTLAYLNQVY